MNDARLAAIVLAGDRGPDDPLAVAAGVAGKALVPVRGRSLLWHVMAALSGVESLTQIVLVSPDHPAYQEGLCPPEHIMFDRIDPARGPAASVVRAFDRIDDGAVVLLVTADHPLMKPDWIEQLIAGAERAGSDAAVGVADFAAVAQRFPGSRRTRYRFADRAVCGTNLFVFRSPAGRAVAGAWQAFEADRKRPWRIISRIGPWNLIRFVLGRLTLAQALDRLSARLEAKLDAVVIPDPLSAVDVDTPKDLALVQNLFDRQHD